MNLEEKVVGINPHKAGKTPHRRRRIGMRKRTAISIFAVIGIALAMTAGAALLTFYGTIETTVDVKQSIQIKAGGGDDWHTWNEPVDTFVVPEEAPGGESFCYKFWVRNRASVGAPIWFKNTDFPSCGITTSVYAFPDEITLELDNKDDSWNRLTGDDIKATLVFNPVSPTFDYDLTATGLTPETDYCLIYYADQDPRFGLWGGNNPGKFISTFTTALDGTITVVGQSVELNMNLPCNPDWNIHPFPDYCNNNNGYDNYDHGEGGAKIWLVPATDYDIALNKVVNWNPTMFLFETDLVSYSDCNFKDVPWTMSLWADNPITDNITILSGEQVPFFVCYTFDIAVNPGGYVLRTSVRPGTL